MPFSGLPRRTVFFLRRLRERLWVRPLAMALLSIAMVFAAHLADGSVSERFVPEVTEDSVEKLLTVISASMLAIATFSVASMLAAYASAAGSATPRSFSLVIADDVSQNALSTFIGAFIFSIVALTALKNSFYGKPGLFTLFLFTMLFFFAVIMTFVRWVDRIARLGRLGNTITKVEHAAAGALNDRCRSPRMGARAVRARAAPGRIVEAPEVGYVQRVDLASLQAYAEEAGAHVVVRALPGTFATPGRALAEVFADAGREPPADAAIAAAFVIGEARTFDEDPRFGLVVLSEIASRALSPAVNDPGTAIDVLGRLVRLFTEASSPRSGGNSAGEESGYDRVEVPEVTVDDMFDDAFNAIGRDGAGTVEVMVRMQKALGALAATGDAAMAAAAARHSRIALERAERALKQPEDLAAVRAAATAVG